MLNTHLHAVFPDGVFSRRTSGLVEFHELRQPAPDDLEEIAFNVHQRFIRWLHRHGLLKNEEDDEFSNKSPELSVLEACAQRSLGLGNLVKKRASQEIATRMPMIVDSNKAVSTVVSAQATVTVCTPAIRFVRRTRTPESD